MNLDKELSQVKFKKHKLPRVYENMLGAIIVNIDYLLSDRSFINGQDSTYQKELVQTSNILKEFINAKKYKFFGDRYWIEISILPGDLSTQSETTTTVKNMQLGKTVVCEDKYLFSPETQFELSAQSNIRSLLRNFDLRGRA